MADNNRLTSFRGASPQPKLEILSLKGNPVTHHPRYRVMCLLAFGDRLRKIDGEVVREVERDEARLFGPIAARAVRAGWLVDDNPRSEDEFSQLAHVYESKAQGMRPPACFLGVLFDILPGLFGLLGCCLFVCCCSGG